MQGWAERDDVGARATEADDQHAPPVLGIVLAAGGGTRYGHPKALAHTAGGTPWLHRAIEALTAGGCSRVMVALGAATDQVRRLIPAGVQVVEVGDWRTGLSATVRVAMRELASSGAEAGVVVPVDTPGIPAAAVARVIAEAVRAAALHLPSPAPPRSALVQATYRGRPGHPVLIGADHAVAVAAAVSGDRGAGAYLTQHGALMVACDDLWSGRDVDVRDDLP